MRSAEQICWAKFPGPSDEEAALEAVAARVGKRGVKLEPRRRPRLLYARTLSCTAFASAGKREEANKRRVAAAMGLGKNRG
ncbi:hypothetical protein MRX96_028537 [Rhipicephalus microplus]